MKAINYINKIIKDNACSIHTAELLTKALHRENIMSDTLAIRFRPLYGDFDIVNSDWLSVGITHNAPITMEELKETTLNLMELYKRMEEHKKKHP